MCHQKMPHHTFSVSVCGCDCGSAFRHFISKDEEKECLKKYEDKLKKELKGVEERIQELKNK